MTSISTQEEAGALNRKGVESLSAAVNLKGAAGGRGRKWVVQEVGETERGHDRKWVRQDVGGKEKEVLGTCNRWGQKWAGHGDSEWEQEVGGAYHSR